jgi:hypothetical protein
MMTKAKNDEQLRTMLRDREKQTGQKLPLVMAIQLKLDETYGCKSPYGATTP